MSRTEAMCCWALTWRLPQLDLQAGAVGVEEFEIADHAAVVTLARQLGGRGRGGEGFTKRGGLLGAIPDLGEGGFHVFYCRQHRLAVVGDGLFPAPPWPVAPGQR